MNGNAESAVPSGTVTFLFTDIEGSTRLWEQDPERMRPALAHHDALARTVVEGHHGTVVKMIGDGVHAAFADPLDAVDATVQLQRALADSEATGGVPLRVRCGLHLGVVEHRDNDFFGSAVNRAARIMAAAHGGQVIVSQAVAERVADRLPQAMSLRDLGAVRLRDLASPERVYQIVHPLLRQDFPALRSLEATPNNLTQQVSSFVGRERERDDLKELLAHTRLATLLGAGGLGKSRLSLHVAVDLLDRFPDGVWLVELAPLADARLLAQAVASVLGVKEEAGRPVQEALMKFVKDRQLLLVLDNCEHLLQACAEMAKQLLQAGPLVKILATSREPLHVAGETTYQVPALSVPEPQVRLAHTALSQYESVRLFVDRVVAAQPTFQLTAQNASIVADICHRLDGIPLALELAAARVRALSVESIAARLSDCFRLLTGGDRTALPRQKTLRACIDWSYDLLSEPERALLRRLAVFAGGWSVEAAEAIGPGQDVAADEVLDLLTQLVEKSLVTMEADGKRYRLLETVRQYALEKLKDGGDDEVVRERHRDYFLALAEEAEPKLLSAEQAAWLRRLDEEHDNLRAALKWSLVAAGSAEGLRLCAALQRFWMTRGHLTEGREWYAQVLGVTGVPERTPARASALNGAGLLAYHQLDYSAARARHEESLAIWRQLDDKKGMAASLNNLGMVALDQGDFASARALHEESLAISRGLGNRNAVARSLGNLGMVAAELRDFVAARALGEECLAIMRELGDRGGVAISLHALGDAICEQGDFASARTLYQESLTILHELGHKGRIAYTLKELGSVVAALGGPLRAARIWGAAERLREEVGSLPPSERPRGDPSVDAARAAVGDDAAFDEAWQEGRTLTLEQAIALTRDDGSVWN